MLITSRRRCLRLLVAFGRRSKRWRWIGRFAFSPGFLVFALSGWRYLSVENAADFLVLFIGGSCGNKDVSVSLNARSREVSVVIVVAFHM